jgi:ubiquinone/menaquinone biosynthesis C-methylase UbiE
MPTSYDRSAWFYDLLSRMVFGCAQVNAQVCMLKHIPAGANVLIVGGGTGWILAEISKIHPMGLHITYIEISASMNILARNRNIGNNKVHFITDAIEHYNASNSFDVVITPFLFDNFSEQTASKVFVHIHEMLSTNACWLYTDFQLTGKWWQKPLLKAMYTFFKLLGNIETSHLPEVNNYFEVHGYTLKEEKTFYADFIISKAYQRT